MQKDFSKGMQVAKEAVALFKETGNKLKEAKAKCLLNLVVRLFDARRQAAVFCLPVYTTAEALSPILAP